MRRRIVPVAVVAVLQGIALVLAHDLTYLARYGSRYGEALAHAGHGQPWSAAVATSAGLALLLAMLAVGRLAQLGLEVRRLERAARGGSYPRLVRRPRLSTIAPGLARSGALGAALTVVLLSVQENVERGALGIPADAQVLLSPEYAGGIWIALAVGFAIGAIVALFRWRIGALLARIERAGRAAVRSTTPAPRPPAVLLAPTASILGRRSALRAPPLGSAS